MASVKTLSGYVVNAAGAALASKTVTLKNASSGATVTTTTTDSDGFWSFANQDESIVYKVEVAVGGSSSQVYVRRAAGAEFSHVYATTSLRTASGATVAFGGAVSVAGALTVSTGGATISGTMTLDTNPLVSNANTSETLVRTRNTDTGGVQWAVGTSGSSGVGGAGTFVVHRYNSSAVYQTTPLRVGTSDQVGLGTSTFGSGTGSLLAIAEVTGAPSGATSNTGILYVQSGALKYKGAGGTITTLAAT